MSLNSVQQWRKVTKRFKKLPVQMRWVFKDAYPRQLDLTRRLFERGVRMIVGTDGGLLAGPGLTLKEEFAELGKAGIGALDILKMATVNAAEYLDRLNDMGTVEPGRYADLVVLHSNPLERVENLHDIAAVVRAGVYHSRQSLEDMKMKVAANRGSL